MGFLDRLRGKGAAPSAPPEGLPRAASADAPAPPISQASTSLKGAPLPRATAVTAHLYSGDEELEIVGESNYQAELWAIVGGGRGDRIRQPIAAVLVPEPTNDYDANAVSVQIDGHRVGYLRREDAAVYSARIRNMMDHTGSYVALEGVVVGGGSRDQGRGMLGVWLDHDPADFGLARSPRSSGQAAAGVWSGELRTGFSEAWLADADDDDYDLSWYEGLADADRPAIAQLRELLSVDPDPIDRHFQFTELEARLYRCRDLYETALAEYDEACQQHDAEMGLICEKFKAKWGKVPLLDTYRQMAIRQQKQKNWNACLWWAERGLSLYGNDAARDEAVEDLTKRRNRARAKLDTPGGERRPPRTSDFAAPLGDPIDRPPPPQASVDLEVLRCGNCGGTFERPRVRGPKPRLCPECRRAG